MNKKVLIIVILIITLISSWLLIRFMYDFWPNSYLRYLILPKFKTVTEYYDHPAILACSQPILVQKQFKEVTYFWSGRKTTELLYLPVNKKEAELFCKVIIME